MKLKLQLIILLMIPVVAFSQVNELNFNKKFEECLNQWSVLPLTKEDSSYLFGYIYDDKEHGITFYKEGHIGLDENGKFVALPLKKGVGNRIKLIEDIGDFAILSEAKLLEMGVPLIPNWFQKEPVVEAPITDYISKGVDFNKKGKCDKALIYLEQAYKMDKHYDGLESQLAYAYKVTHQYKKIIDVLSLAIINDPDEIEYYRELAIAYIRVGDMINAEKISFEALEFSKDKVNKAKICLNMAEAYYISKDKDNYKFWARKTKKFAKNNSKEMDYIKSYNKTFNNKLI